MFRTALLRSARCLAQAAPRVQVSVASRVVPNSFLMSRTAGPSTMIPSIRAYSAHAGLSQDEVQGRILDLLKNFDKVGHAQLRRERFLADILHPGHRFIKGIRCHDTLNHVLVQCSHQEALPHRTLHQRPWSRQLGHCRGRHGN